MKIKNKLFGLAMAGMIGLSSLGTVSTYAATDTTTSTAAVHEETAKNAKATLDAASQEKVQAIMDKLTTGLQNLGVILPEKGDKTDLFADLDADTKAKAEVIMVKMKADTITFDEAQTQLKELGVTLPGKADKAAGQVAELLAGLDADTKAKAQKLIDQAETHLAEYDIDHLPLHGFNKVTKAE
ncbi:hypothetical protein L2D08_15300 [Domibacillus sp. PGB-M46]|uniref:hypothetical protein n=1 Tax=Domibacillus sp. PGB-M46 TaxID=2910255 RepID=UPI001F582C8B|nr:hypothetical protein [Domibacillus sp. PGB-M46]MCI2255737.1 hypothetical protein [Domibacillus sp. PGB-M46]